jgi:hypothetical protein
MSFLFLTGEGAELCRRLGVRAHVRAGKWKLLAVAQFDVLLIVPLGTPDQGLADGLHDRLIKS